MQKNSRSNDTPPRYYFVYPSGAVAPIGGGVAEGELSGVGKCCDNCSPDSSFRHSSKKSQTKMWQNRACSLCQDNAAARFQSRNRRGVPLRYVAILRDRAERRHNTVKWALDVFDCPIFVGWPLRSRATVGGIYKQPAARGIAFPAADFTALSRSGFPARYYLCPPLWPDIPPGLGQGDIRWITKRSLSTSWSK